MDDFSQSPMNRLKGLMGLCVRAGQAVFGEDSCLKAVRENRAALLLIDESISENSRRKAEPLCERNGVPVIRLRPGLLEESTGRPGKVMAVRAGSFAEQMIRLAGENAGQNKQA